MDNEKLNDPLKEIYKALVKESKSISEKHNIYFRSFPRDASLGVELSDKKAQKKLAIAYFQYVSFIATSVTSIESALSGLTPIMLQADKDMRYERIATCDEMMTRYGEFKKAISHFTEQNERLIIENKISSPKMLRYLSEFGYKLNYFCEYLNGLDL